MKRWLVKTSDGDELKLYYRTHEEALTSYKAVSAEEIMEYSCDISVQTIQDNGRLILSTCIEEKSLEKSIYRLDSPLGSVDVQIHRDISDGLYYDFVQYREHRIGSFVEPITWCTATLEDFILMFIHKKSVNFRVHSFRKYGDAKLPKPEELRGKTQDFSVLFFEKCKCGCFVVGDDVWIKHRDFFSASFEPPPEDMDKPLSYLARKYFNHNKSDKFIYPDGWGDIVLRNEAWLVIENIVPLAHNDNIISLKALIAQSFVEKTKCHWPNYEWESFFERLIDKVIINRRSSKEDGRY